LDFLHQQNNFWCPATNLLNSPFSEAVILPPLQTWILLDFLHQQNNFWCPATNLLNSPSLKLWSYHHSKLESYWTSSINKTISDDQQQIFWIHLLWNCDPTTIANLNLIGLPPSTKQILTANNLQFTFSKTMILPPHCK
jgi:hypothetical protein